MARPAIPVVECHLSVGPFVVLWPPPATMIYAHN